MILTEVFFHNRIHWWYVCLIWFVFIVFFCTIIFRLFSHRLVGFNNYFLFGFASCSNSFSNFSVSAIVFPIIYWSRFRIIISVHSWNERKQNEERIESFCYEANSSSFPSISTEQFNIYIYLDLWIDLAMYVVDCIVKRISMLL